MTVRAPIVSFLLALAVAGGLLPPGAAAPAAAATLKVAIIVGPTAITDSHYLPSAEQIEATAVAAGAVVDLRYCATPAEAREAVSGANIVVYLGHGNGFPNPYSSTLYPDRVNGWGLNRTTTNGDSDSWSKPMR